MSRIIFEVWAYWPQSIDVRRQMFGCVEKSVSWRSSLWKSLQFMSATSATQKIRRTTVQIMCEILFRVYSEEPTISPENRNHKTNDIKCLPTQTLSLQFLANILGKHNIPKLSHDPITSLSSLLHLLSIYE